MILTHNRDSEYQIIYPQNPTPSEKYAVAELKKYLFKITGAMIPEFQDNRHEEDKEIIVGFTSRGGYTDAEKEELGKEGFIIKTVDEKIYIIGSGVRGALYGVYSFLEEYCGCRFYTNDFEKVPVNRELEIPAVEYNKQVPQFFYRNPYWKSVGDVGIAAKLKINGCHGRERFPDYLGGDVNYQGGFEHTIGWLSGQCPYGERAWVQPCLSDENVYQTVIGNIRNMLKEHPDASLISITQNDGDTGACKCDKCRPINEAEESGMGTMLKFVNRIAEELEPEYPDVLFDTFAYRFTRKPPKTIRPRKNVVVRLCSIECCFRHPLSDCDITPGHDDVERSFAIDLKEWSEVAPNLTIWNYTTNFTNFSVLFPNIETWRKNARFFAEHKAKGLFEQGNYASLNGEFGELKGYMLARTCWDPYMSEEKYVEYIKEFIMDFYGPGGNHMMDYIKMVLDNSKEAHLGIYYDTITNYLWIKDCETKLEGQWEFILRANQMFDAMEEAAETDVQLANIRRTRIHLLDYIDFTIRDEREAAETEEQKAELTEQLHENQKKRFDYMRKYNVTHNHEFHDIDSLSDPNYEQHVLLWKCPNEF